MKGIAIVAALFALLSFSGMSYASDWDLVGKVLTGVEGARILTGGKIDIIGSVIDIGRGRPETVVHEKRVYVVEKPACERTWVPEYTWRKVWVPGHTERDPRRGRVYIEGHYVKYKVECGGHWEYAHSNERDYCSRRGGRH